MTLATRFAFDQEQFDLLCSDSLRFPIARAVAASSAVPLLLSPVTLKNYAARGCGYELPGWVGEELEGGYAPTRRHQEALRVAQYRAAGDEAYVHLLDGSLSDNLGLRLTIEKAVEAGGYSRLDAAAGFTRYRRVAYLIVNAQTDSKPEWSRSAQPPGALETLTSATTVAVNRYNYETVELFRNGLGELVRELRELRCQPAGGAPAPADCADVAAHLVEVAFAQHPDPAERAYLSALPTSFRLTHEEVERTIAAAGRILRASPEFQALLADLAH